MTAYLLARLIGEMAFDCVEVVDMADEIELRPELKAFAEQMERSLRENDSKKGDSWKSCDINFLANKLREEMDEIEEGGEPDEMVDLANICFFLWYRAKLSI
jgi:hypothetical protein